MDLQDQRQPAGRRGDAVAGQHPGRSTGEVLRHPEEACPTCDEHAALLDAIAKDDAKSAARAVTAHVTTAHARVGELIDAAAKQGCPACFGGLPSGARPARA